MFTATARMASQSLLLLISSECKCSIKQLECEKTEYTTPEEIQLSARWVSLWLTIYHKRNQVTSSKVCLVMFNRNLDEFLHLFKTVDETCIHHNTPHPNSNQTVGFSERIGFKDGKSGSVHQQNMETIAWDLRGTIHIGYFQKRTINSEYFPHFLEQFNDLRKIRPVMTRNKIHFH